MSMTRNALTEADIRALSRGATVDERAAAAAKICREVGRARLSDTDRAAAEDILRIMAADAAELVRRALAVTLKSSPLVPRDVALRLARDVESIAVPILSESPVFTDADLVEIVRLGGPVRQMVIAKRPRVSRPVTDAIVEHGDERAVAAACANDNADMAEATLQQVLRRFEKSERVLAAVAYRQALPLPVTEKLITLVGEQLREHLIQSKAAPAELVATVALGARERATVDLVDQAGRAADMKAFVAHLHKHGRLSASLLLRGLAHGNMNLFEWGVAELASVPHHRTWLMVHDAGPLGLRAIYERAGLPVRLYPAFRAAVDTFHALEGEGVSCEAGTFQERMLQRFLTQPQTALREDVDYLLDRLDRRQPGKPAVLAETA